MGIFWALRDRIGRAPLAAALFFSGTLFPALGFFSVYPMRFAYVADHYQYLASLGVIVPAAAGLRIAAGRLRLRATVAWALLGTLLAVLGISTAHRARVFESSETLWRDTLSKNPAAWMAHVNLGDLLMRRGDYEESVRHLEAASALVPNDLGVLKNLAWVRATCPDTRLRDPQAALVLAQRVCALAPGPDPGALDILAAAYAANGRFPEAVETARRALILARSHKRVRLERDIETRLSLYQSGRAL